ncbi:Homoserine O-acetyltransferase [Methylophaga frappieri]|uniref:Homoserine O-succinyltransferase n=1 Tax=Methylophaga frappieri (strain ATCC BAA-2434 / DSM 25690 / JAM7) TaxID=754477 RepID=I1YIN7_METFJ|nr:homoserine O-acetyltransferase [Methylophaga frappieri]AFJ02780.1 Homoserine O-acetyltransferase [Methylophaga frappieri]
MPDSLPADSVGIVAPHTLHVKTPLTLDCGRTLPEFTLIYETYGQLNADKSNAVLICHALSGDHHAAGYHDLDDRKPGWWESAIGPGKAIDTNHFFVVCPNNLGGCKGSTGPTTINPETGQVYGPDFPIVTVNDWVNSQAILADTLGVSQWAAVIGGSLGGMQALQWAISLPNRLRHALIIAAAPKLSAQNIAFNEVARTAIKSDPDFHDGHYAAHNTLPRQGLGLARMLGHITYLSDEAMGQKFGRELRSGAIQYGYGVEFQIESYLRYQSSSFVERFDANTYLLMTKSLDYFDPAKAFNDDLSAAMQPITAKTLVMSFTSDWRFSPLRSLEIVNAMLTAGKQVSYAEIEANQGHDAFLMPIPRYMEIFSTYMQQVAREVNL